MKKSKITEERQKSQAMQSDRIVRPGATPCLLLVGDALEELKRLPSETADMCITSPPYWALRDYGVEGQLGLEPTFDNYIEKLCRIFDEVRKPPLIHPLGRNKRCVWTIPNKPFKEAHFAVYPPELIETPIRAGCPENGIVLDPFSGSGTTAEVALRLGRKAIGIDLNPEYIEMSKRRVEPFLKEK